MDQTLREYLEQHNIKYRLHKHPAVFTVEEAKKLANETQGFLHTKNLFLKDENKRFFLVSMYAYKRLDLRSFAKKINAKKKLSFASVEQLKEHLNLAPGSVSIFGMIYAKDVTLIIDKQVWQAKKVGFHPNSNIATLELDHENLERFYNSLNAEKYVMDL